MLRLPAATVSTLYPSGNSCFTSAPGCTGAGNLMTYVPKAFPFRGVPDVARDSSVPAHSAVATGSGSHTAPLRLPFVGIGFRPPPIIRPVRSGPVLPAPLFVRCGYPPAWIPASIAMRSLMRARA